MIGRTKFLDAFKPERKYTDGKKKETEKKETEKNETGRSNY